MPLFCIEWAQSFDQCGRPGPPDLPEKAYDNRHPARAAWVNATVPRVSPVVLLQAAASRFNKPDAQHFWPAPRTSYNLASRLIGGTDGTIPDPPKLALKIALVKMQPIRAATPDKPAREAVACPARVVFSPGLEERSSTA